MEFQECVGKTDEKRKGMKRLYIIVSGVGPVLGLEMGHLRVVGRVLLLSGSQDGCFLYWARLFGRGQATHLSSLSSFLYI
jgi:hypothetical protein